MGWDNGVIVLASTGRKKAVFLESISRFCQPRQMTFYYHCLQPLYSQFTGGLMGLSCMKYLLLVGY